MIRAPVLPFILLLIQNNTKQTKTISNKQRQTNKTWKGEYRHLARSQTSSGTRGEEFQTRDLCFASTTTNEEQQTHLAPETKTNEQKQNTTRTV
jgi:hypothetical protein